MSREFPLAFGLLWSSPFLGLGNAQRAAFVRDVRLLELPRGQVYDRVVEMPAAGYGRVMELLDFSVPCARHGFGGVAIEIGPKREGHCVALRGR